MNSLTQALALAAALALGQTSPEAEGSPPRTEPPAEPPEKVAPEPTPEAKEPVREKAVEPPVEAKPAEEKAAPEPTPPAPAVHKQPAAPAPAVQKPPPASPAPAPPAPAKAPPTPEREQVARAALAFLDALVKGDADALAAACGERFSFDGDVRSGSAVRSGWREVLSRRSGPARLLDLEVLSAADAVARYGPPPPRLAPLARGWVAVANVSGRPIVLFVAREGGRFAVVGMQG